MPKHVLHKLLITTAVSVSFSAAAGAGCCLAPDKISALQSQSQRRGKARFQRLARSIAAARGAKLVPLRPDPLRRRLPFGKPQLVKRNGGPRVVVAGRRTVNQGIATARTPDGGWLVIVAKPQVTYRSVRGCRCRSHGGMQWHPPPPPLFALPTTDLARVRVVYARYRNRAIDVSRSRCGGPPVP